MGSMHDIYVSPDPGAYDYSHGYADPQNRFITVMAYDTICADQRTYCRRIPYWSCPDAYYNGKPTGDAAVANNLLSLNNTAPIVASFRGSKLVSPPGTSLPAVQKADLTGEWRRVITKNQKVFSTVLRITNAGQATSGSFSVSFYRSTDGIELTQLLKTRIIRRKLLGGRSLGLGNIFRFPELISGEYIIAVLDTENVLDELDKENNRAVHMVP
jgi:hypothetical protein